jgi:hypothetical protein
VFDGIASQLSKPTDVLVRGNTIVRIAAGQSAPAARVIEGRDEVLTATRENLRFGASHIKLMAGGGTSSD